MYFAATVDIVGIADQHEHFRFDRHFKPVSTTVLSNEPPEALLKRQRWKAINLILCGVGSLAGDWAFWHSPEGVVGAAGSRGDAEMLKALAELFAKLPEETLSATFQSDSRICDTGEGAVKARRIQTSLERGGEGAPIRLKMAYAQLEGMRKLVESERKRRLRESPVPEYYDFEGSKMQFESMLRFRAGMPGCLQNMNPMHLHYLPEMGLPCRFDDLLAPLNV